MKTLITLFGALAVVSVAACKDKSDVGQTNTTSAETTSTVPTMGINDLPPADPTLMMGDAAKPLVVDQPTQPVKYVAGADGGMLRDGGMNMDKKGSSFESSGGSSGLGTPAHADVPGQKIWSTK